MRKLLKEISVIPGVSGSCIFDKNDGAVCTEMDAHLPQDLTENVGIHFVRLVQMGRMNKLDISSAHFRFDRYSVVGLPLDKGAILLAICDSQANCSLVATTAAMLVEDMRGELNGTVPAANGTAAALAGEVGIPVSGTGDAEIDARLKEIEEALVAAIGPVGGMVVADYLAKWRTGGPIVASRLPELISMLVEEIGDAGLSAEFKQQLRHLL